MKATLEPNGSNQWVLKLTPESDEDKRHLNIFGPALSRSHYISFRGFQYLKEDVEFIVAPWGKQD